MQNKIPSAINLYTLIKIECFSHDLFHQNKLVDFNITHRATCVLNSKFLGLDHHISLEDRPPSKAIIMPKAFSGSSDNFSLNY
jgi:hypothetical protein